MTSSATGRDRQSIIAESLQEIRRLRAEAESVQQAQREPIAVVGMACRMPGGATDPGAFWDFLRQGGNGVSDIPGSRWDIKEYYDPSPDAPGRMYTRRGGFLPDIDRFDAAFFGVSNREAAWLDPQQRLLLELGWEALEDAGQGPDELTGSDTGVYFGITSFDYSQRQMQEVNADDLEAYSLTGNASTFAAGRLSYWLGLSGPSLSLDTACSSSLVAVHLACQGLRSGEISAAVVGGVNVLLSPEWSVVTSRARMLAPDGRCKTFDASADGYVRSEGCGVVILKRLSDARRNGDRVLAVLRGSAVNQDGRSSGITVPNAAAQSEVIRRALASASVSPSEVNYVETHGTGTPLGDPIELRALAAALGDRDDADPVLVGSVKTNIGHLEPAAGIAGLIKVVLSLQNDEIPPHLHLEEVNPEIGIDELPLRIPTGPTPWPRGGTPRIAGVSGFGASGTNAHVIVADAPDDVTEQGPVHGPERTAHVLTVSARTPAALDQLVTRYRDRLAAAAEDELGDICFTAAVGRKHFVHRVAVIGSSGAELAARLAAVDTSVAGARRGRVLPGHRPKVAFVFTGQGAQYHGMGATLYATEPAFRAAIDRCEELLGTLLPRPLRAVLGYSTDADAALIDETEYTQPAMFAVEYALARLWRSWGIEPAFVLGHSLGELTAACVAGVMSLADGLRLAVRRGQLMHELTERGAMATVFAEPDRVRQALLPWSTELSLAAVNGPQSVAVSGSESALQALLGELTKQGVRSKRLSVTRAFHSPLMEPMLDRFEQEAAQIRFARPTIPIVSNVTGSLLGKDEFDAGYLARHVRMPVEFLAGMNTLFEQGCDTFLEIGPAPVLVGMAKRFAPRRPKDAQRFAFLPSLRSGQDDWRVMLDSLAALHTAGAQVDWAGLDAGRARRRTAIPTYPFEHNVRHWYRPSGRSATPVGDTAPEPSPSFLGRRLPSPLDVVQYRSRLSTAQHPCLNDCQLDGLPVVNIGVYLETALAAAHDLQGVGPVLLKDVLIRQSMVLRPGEDRDVQLTVQPAADSWTFTYHSQDSHASGEEFWPLHCQGRIHTGAAAGDALDLDAIRDGLPQEMTGEDFYRRMTQRKITLGPSARWIEHMRYGGGAALARMRAPLPDEADRYLMHPGLTDAVFQVLLGCLPAEAPSDEAYMLVTVDHFAFHGVSGRGPLHAYARLHPSSATGSTLSAEAHLYDASGRPVLEARGVYLRRVSREHIARAEQSQSSTVRSARTPAAPVEQRTVLDRAGAEHLLVRAVSAALGMPQAEVDMHEPLSNLGMDSLMALEIKDMVSTQAGVSLPVVTILEGHGITQLATELLTLAGGEDTAQGSAASRTALDHDAAARHEPFPLTDLQQAYLVGRSNAFELGNVSTYFFIEVDNENVDLPRLTSAFRRLVDRHDMLRAVVHPDGFQQVLPEVPGYDIRTMDLRGCDAAERERRLAEIHQEMKNQVFDTASWPLFDIRATLIDEHRTRLHLGLDALIIDGWSTSQLFHEWVTLYRDGTAELPEIAVTYRDYVLARKAMEDGPEYAASLAYWRNRLANMPPAPELPLADNPGRLVRPVFTHRTARLDAGQWARFKEFAASIGVTPSAALGAAYAQALAAWSKSSRFTLNVLFFNRQQLHPDVRNIVGNFSSTTLLEVDSNPLDDFATRARRIQHQLLSDLEHSHVSGVEVLRELNRVRGTAAATMPVVYASTVNFAANQEEGSAGLAEHLLRLGENGEEVSTSIRTPQVWLDHQVVEEAGELVVNWDVVEEIFPDGMIDTMFAAYLGGLRELCTGEQPWHRPAPMLVPEAELDRRRAVNETTGPFAHELLHAPFLAQAARSPERTAVIAPGRTLTYGELDRRSDAVADWLVEGGAAPGALVGVVMEKGWEQVVAVLGVLKSGAAYVPIDVAVPTERLRLLLDTADVKLVLTQTCVAERTAWPQGVQVLPVDMAAATGRTPVSAAGPAQPGDLAYVIFTSGSTGIPKGVMIEHAAALNTVHDINDRFEIGESDRVLALSALNFDLSVYDVFGLLAAGGALVLPEPDALREPGRWLELVAEHGVTVWNTVPALMEMFTEHALATDRTAAVPLRTVMMSGDWIPVTLPDRIRDLVPGAAVWSLGGATEASVWSILHPIDRVDLSWASIPYGTPMRNQQFAVLNDAMQPCPVWVPGQLYISGAGLARGYLGDEGRTRAAFIRHPITGERLYRTGDLGRYLPDGTIEFLGREDFQVKVQGYRIELGEIEAALLQHPGVRAAVAAVSGERHGTKNLVAYVVLDEDADLQDPPARLRQALGETLPAYFVPQHILVLDALPLSANGKVDRAALPSPDAPGGQSGDEVLPRDEVEKLLAGIWQQFFGPDSIGVHVSFFTLGGNSLMAVRLMARIQQLLGCSLPISTLFASPTIALLAEAVRAAGATARRSALVPINAAGSKPPLFIVHPVGGDVLCYAGLAGLLGDDQPCYGLQTPDGDPVPATVTEMAAHYTEAVTKLVPRGPYRLAGWSMGGVIALEMARQLTEADAAVDLVTVVDLLEPPGDGSIEPVSDAELLAWLGKDLAGLAGQEWQPTPDLFRPADGRTPLEVLHTEAVRRSILPADIDLETLGSIVDRFTRNSRALLAHVPRPYTGEVRFIRAQDGASVDTAKQWMQLFEGASALIELPGDHYTVMRPPLLNALADAFRD
ncbi:hybrid non-ribosomal peptide synthetase/type I polyketide synthase [Streptomyces rimosus]|uniref:hybrid non-ribosomal peptide synthetase/type I polyketide synthase n=1 Tax=Streptomyces rimosus TaxID=1927 RepID=UPI00067B0FA2|nr:hybrid non-ribosomal peptide synthetase/type I polyketide synthase [Streptomyces rimosus]